jgi:F-type H+-transporting ATPase subunit a
VLLGIGLLSGAIGSGFFGNITVPGWLRVPRPEIKLAPETVFHIFSLPVTNTIIGAWVSIILLVGLSYIITRKIKLIPSRLQNMLEFTLEGLLNFCKSVAGERNGRLFFPLVATIFLFVIVNAWLSLLPGFGSILATNPEGEVMHLLRGANTDINMALALALVSFIFVEYFGLKVHGLRYLTKFFNFGSFFKGAHVLVRGNLSGGLSGIFHGGIHIFVGFLEAIGELVRIVSFTFRLFGNMIAGEILILVVFFLVPLIAVIPFYGLELLVGFVQALIFSGLTLIFANLAVSHQEAEAS